MTAVDEAIIAAMSDNDLDALLSATYCRQQLNRIAASASCCLQQALIAEPPPSGSKHFKKAVCGSCGKFFGWIGKPKNLTTRKSSTLGIAPDRQCVICLATEKLEVHHIIEIQDGGDNGQSNRMTLCSGCHALVHWVRQYRGV